VYSHTSNKNNVYVNFDTNSSYKVEKQLTQFHLALRILTPKELIQEETVKQRY